MVQTFLEIEKTPSGFNKMVRPAHNAKTCCVILERKTLGGHRGLQIYPLMLFWGIPKKTPDVK